ncbi:MAG: flagellin [Methylobacter sp.]
MSLYINTNYQSLYGQRQLRQHRLNVEKSTQEMSSGQRINSAQDDAAGLAMSSRMTTGIRAHGVLIRNVTNGISLAQTAEGALGSIIEILQRTRELAVQSANWTLAQEAPQPPGGAFDEFAAPSANGDLALGDRQKLSSEFNQLLQEIDRIANTTEIFGKFPLKHVPPHITNLFPTSGASSIFSSGIKPIAYIPVGAQDIQIDIDSYNADDDIQLFTLDGKHLAGTPLTDSVWTANSVSDSADIKSKIFDKTSGFTDNAVYDSSLLLDGSTAFTDPTMNPPTTGLTQAYNGMDIVYSGDGHGLPPPPPPLPTTYNERILIDNVTEPLMLMVVGSGLFSASASWSFMPPSDELFNEPFKITVSANVNESVEYINIDKAPSDLASLKLNNTKIDPYQEAIRALASLDAAINQIDNYRTHYGASINRLQTVISNIDSSNVNLNAARSRITDTDYAKSMADLISNQVLSNAGVAMLAQANVTPKQTLQNLLNSIRIKT